MENLEKKSMLEPLYADMRELQVETPGHFGGMVFNMEELTGSDGAIWEEIKDGSLTKPELEEYAKEVKESGSETRLTFLAIVNNKALGIFLDREVAERRKNKKEGE